MEGLDFLSGLFFRCVLMIEIVMNYANMIMFTNIFLNPFSIETNVFRKYIK